MDPINADHLTTAAFDRAAQFIRTQARPLEQALFALEFEDGRRDQVVAELRVYQNEDGGFGALESDFGSSVSSVLNTTHALHILRELDAPGSDEVVAGAMSYIVAAYEPALTGWPIIPPHDNSAPHAPWWHYTEDFAVKWDQFQDNPRPEVLGYLYTWPTEGSTAFVAEVSAVLIRRIPDLGELSVNALSCYLRLAETPGLPPELRHLLEQHLPRIAGLSIEQDPARWEQYVAKPLDLIRTPQSLLYPAFRDAVAENLRYEIDAQSGDGAWDPNWNWGGAYPEAWEEAQRKWRGVLTLERLRVLRNFGLLPDSASSDNSTSFTNSSSLANGG